MTEQDWNFAEGRFLSYVLAPVEGFAGALFIVLNAAAEDGRIHVARMADAVNDWTQ